MTRLRHPEEIRNRLILAYLDALNADADFKKSVAALYDRLQRSLDEAPREVASEVIENANPSGLTFFVESKMVQYHQPNPPDYLRVRAAAHQVNLDMIQVIDVFCASFPLPQPAKDLVWNSFMLWQSVSPAERPRPSLMGSGLGVFIPPSAWHLPEIGHDESTVFESVGPLNRTIVLPRKQPWIVPKTLNRFRYDPRKESHDSLERRIDRQLNALKKDMLEQAHCFEKQAAEGGMTRLPPAYHSTQTIRQASRRYVLRVVKGLSWAEIAQQTGGVRTSVRDQVKNFATCTGLPLPHGRR